jgi:hypothetical protein
MSMRRIKPLRRRTTAAQRKRRLSRILRREKAAPLKILEALA